MCPGPPNLCDSGTNFGSKFGGPGYSTWWNSPVPPIPPGGIGFWSHFWVHLGSILGLFWCCHSQFVGRFTHNQKACKAKMPIGPERPSEVESPLDGEKIPETIRCRRQIQLRGARTIGSVSPSDKMPDTIRSTRQPETIRCRRPEICSNSST